MWENRISAYFETPLPAGSQGTLPGQFPGVSQAAAPHSPPPAPNLVQKADLYQAARARAMIDCQLGKLFNPDGASE